MIWALVTLLLNTCAQILLKYSSKASNLIVAWIPFLTWQLAAALFVYLLSVVSWIQALRILPLSSAYPVMAAALITVPIASLIFFKESISFGQWLFLGVALVGLFGFTALSK